MHRFWPRKGSRRLMCVDVHERRMQLGCKANKEMVGATGFEPVTSTV
jgi:hypothetical protein